MEKDISTLAKILAPCILTALLAVIAFLVLQNMQLKDDMAEIKLEELARYAEVTQKIALMQFTINGIKVKVDKMFLNQEGGRQWRPGK